MKRIAITGLMLLAFGILSAESGLAAGGLITPEKAKALLETDKEAVLLDVRTAEEFAAGHIAGARLLPYDEITAQTAAREIRSPETAIIVYCRSGRRSAIAAQTLRNLGYRKVRDLGGIGNWPYGIVK